MLLNSIRFFWLLLIALHPRSFKLLILQKSCAVLKAPLAGHAGTMMRELFSFLKL